MGPELSWAKLALVLISPATACPAGILVKELEMSKASFQIFASPLYKSSKLFLKF
jgi:hypothetical protein